MRQSISLTGQFAAVDETLSGRENLVLVARLRHLRDVARIADDLLTRFQLTDAADRRVATYSGGMRRRLDIAMSLIGDPPVIFLDEPTTGLDPQSRIEVWACVKELAGHGTTVLLTTQYLDEAEQLADRIAILHEGRIIADGTLEELKRLAAARARRVRREAAEPRGRLPRHHRRRRPGGRPTTHVSGAIMTTHFFGDTAVLLGRSLRHITRSLDTVLTVAIMPIALMLMFVYVFGGAIDTGSQHYVDYLLPGILLITVAMGISYTAYRLFMDLKSGIFERFQSMPIARSSVLWAHVLTSVVSTLVSLVIVVLVAFLIGFRSSAGVLAWLAVAGILALFTLGVTWLAVIAGLSAKTVDGAGRLLLPADLPAVRQLRLRAHHHDARPGARIRRPPTGDLDRRHDPRAAGQGARRRRPLGGPRLVPRDPRGRLRAGHGGVPPPGRLSGQTSRCAVCVRRPRNSRTAPTTTTIGPSTAHRAWPLIAEPPRTSRPCSVHTHAHQDRGRTPSPSARCESWHPTYAAPDGEGVRRESNG